MAELLRLPDVAKMLGCAQNTVYKMVEDGRLPPPVRTGGIVSWWQHEIEEALEYDKKLVTTRAAMEWLHVSRGTLRRMVEDGRVPRPCAVAVRATGSATTWRPLSLRQETRSQWCGPTPYPLLTERGRRRSSGRSPWRA